MCIVVVVYRKYVYCCGGILRVCVLLWWYTESMCIVVVVYREYVYCCGGMQKVCVLLWWYTESMCIVVVENREYLYCRGGKFETECQSGRNDKIHNLMH